MDSEAAAGQLNEFLAAYHVLGIEKELVQQGESCGRPRSSGPCQCQAFQDVGSATRGTCVLATAIGTIARTRMTTWASASSKSTSELDGSPLTRLVTGPLTSRFRQMQLGHRCARRVGGCLPERSPVAVFLRGFGG